jgi:hypothetical protein
VNVRVLPSVTPDELATMRERAELAEFNADAAVFLFPEFYDALEHQLLVQEADVARARYEAVASQVPDRTPFAGRAR